MSIYITGDIHGRIERFKNNPLTKEDIVIVLGDFGIPWNNDVQGDNNLKWLSEQPYTILFIDGNHEDFDMLYSFPKAEVYGGIVHILVDNIFHLMRGEIYTIAGKTFFCFGGATSVDRWWRTEHETWWKEENYNYMEALNAYDRLDKYNWKVDYVLTHTAPVKFSKLLENEVQHLQPCPTANFLSELEQNIKYKKWFFGHFHLNKDMDKARAVYEDVLIL